MLRPIIPAFFLCGILHAGIDLRLPTDNHHLLSGEPEKFYMYVDRDFEGQKSKPWEGGTYGLVRNALRIGDQVIYTKFHEGIDIAPVNRDKAGNPLDIVSSIAGGKVVHTSPGGGDYGKYVVVEHLWDDSSIYSLYAHLAEITCKTGDEVKAGSPLGRMGFTGTGINRERAHVHLEIDLMLSLHYDEPHKNGVGGPNPHGLYHGYNLSGFDPARLFVELQTNPELRISDYIASIPVHFKVTVPAKGTPDFVTRYPWICHASAEGALSWEISFSAVGVPVAFTPTMRKVDAPVVTWIAPSTIPQRYLTHNLVTGQQENATLTTSGKQLITLLLDDFPATTVSKESIPGHKS